MTKKYILIVHFTEYNKNKLSVEFRDERKTPVGVGILFTEFP